MLERTKAAPETWLTPEHNTSSPCNSLASTDILSIFNFPPEAKIILKGASTRPLQDRDKQAMAVLDHKR